MPSGKLIAGFLVVIVGVSIVSCSRDNQSVYEPEIKKIEPAVPIPWRDATRDLPHWFPGATGYRIHDIILSGKVLTLQQQLNRPLRADELSLHTYLVVSNDVDLGVVLTRRIKGPNGAIEIAIGLSTNRTVQNLKVQRIREPESVTQELAQLSLGKSFENFQIAMRPPTLATNNVSSDAAAIAHEIAVSVKDLLILYEAARRDIPPAGLKSHH